MHSQMFELVKLWHESAPTVWNDAMLATAVSIKWITDAERTEIIQGN
ncbi:hypothetical protein [Furfurilactobacillus cerevisiae]